MSARRQLAFLWAGVAVALIALSPVGARLATGLPACPIRVWLGIPCLTCGSTRAALALASLDPIASLGFNPLAALGWIGLIGGGLIAGGLAALGGPLPRMRFRPTLAHRLLAVAILLVNWVYLVRAGV